MTRDVNNPIAARLLANLLLLSFITPNGSTEKNTIIYTKYKNTFTKQNIKTDYKLKLQFILY